MSTEWAIYARIVIALPAALFWFVYLLPTDSGENWFRVTAWLFLAPISLIAVGPCLYLAIKAKNDVLWWLEVAFCFSPVLWTIAEFGMA